MPNGYSDFNAFALAILRSPLCIQCEIHKLEAMARFLRTETCKVFQPSPLGVVLLLVLILLAACTKVEEEPYPGKIPERPLMVFNDTTLLDYYEGKVLSWKLKTAYLERWGNEGRVFAKPVLVDIYDSVGIKVAFLRSDSGELDSRMSYVHAYGHVYALTPKGASVRADSLVWNKRLNKVVTESFVRVVSEDGDVLQGKGFISDARLDNWQIQSNVTGIFQDAADRMKKEDQSARDQMTADSIKNATKSSSFPISSSSLAKSITKSSSSKTIQTPTPNHTNQMPAASPTGTSVNAATARQIHEQHMREAEEREREKHDALERRVHQLRALK